MKDKIIDKIIGFDKLLGLTALTIALVAAFFSVYGIATLFAGAFVLTAIMASTLEVGKLVAVTYLYRFWSNTKGFLKTYLSIATLVLMVITSLGIFGFLSAAYQKSAIEFKAGQEKIVMVEGKKVYLNDKIKQSTSRINTLNEMRRMQESRMNESLTNAFISRSPIQLKQLQDQTAEMIKEADKSIKGEQDVIQKATDDIAQIDQQVNDMKFASAGKKDIRTFQFVADQFGTTLDTVAKYFIFVIICVFDPLAVALVLAYNVATYKKENEEPKEKPKETPAPQPFELTNSKSEGKVEIVNSPVTSDVKPSSIQNDLPSPRPSWLQ